VRTIALPFLPKTELKVINDLDLTSLRTYLFKHNLFVNGKSKASTDDNHVGITYYHNTK
jgi:hypothetical protein